MWAPSCSHTISYITISKLFFPTWKRSRPTRAISKSSSSTSEQSGLWDSGAQLHGGFYFSSRISQYGDFNQRHNREFCAASVLGSMSLSMSCWAPPLCRGWWAVILRLSQASDRREHVVEPDWHSSLYRQLNRHVRMHMQLARLRILGKAWLQQALGERRSSPIFCIWDFRDIDPFGDRNVSILRKKFAKDAFRGG